MTKISIYNHEASHLNLREMRVADLHTDLIGKLCKLTQHGVLLEKEYEEIFKVGNTRVAELLFFYHQPGPFQILLMFIDQPPWRKDSQTWFCVKEIGKGCFGDWH